MDEFEKLLHENLIPLQRYVNFKIGNRHDAEDVIQDGMPYRHAEI